ncbi:hypothetical protein SMMN14_08346 [Sphaerulina musiva]
MPPGPMKEPKKGAPALDSEVKATSETANSALKKETATHLENIVRAQADAVNSRQILVDDTAFTSHCTADFVHLATPPWLCESSTLQETLDRLKRTFVEDPEYRMVITDLNTEIIGGHWARVFLSFEAHGHPPGMIRPFMAIHRFRKDDGQWKLYSIESTTGVL